MDMNREAVPELAKCFQASLLNHSILIPQMLELSYPANYLLMPI